MPVSVITRRSESYVDIVVDKRQTRSLQRVLLTKDQKTVIVRRSRTLHLAFNSNRAAGSFCAGGDVERVQSVHIVRGASRDLLGFRHHVESIRGRIDDWRTHDANFQHHVRAL